MRPDSDVSRMMRDLRMSLIWCEGKERWSMAESVTMAEN